MFHDDQHGTGRSSSPLRCSTRWSCRASSWTRPGSSCSVPVPPASRAPADRDGAHRDNFLVARSPASSSRPQGPQPVISLVSRSRPRRVRWQTRCRGRRLIGSRAPDTGNRGDAGGDGGSRSCSRCRNPVPEIRPGWQEQCTRRLDHGDRPIRLPGIRSTMSASRSSSAAPWTCVPTASMKTCRSPLFTPSGSDAPAGAAGGARYLWPARRWPLGSTTSSNR